MTSDTNHVVYVKMSGPHSLKPNPNDKFLRNYSWQFYFLRNFHGIFNSLSEFLLVICWEEIAEDIFFISYSVLMPDLLDLMSTEPTLYLLNYGDFNLRKHNNMGPNNTISISN